MKMKYNLEGKVFTAVTNTDGGEVSRETLFYYHQNDDIITADYNGGMIIQGHIIGKILDTGQLDFVYHHINNNNQLMVGKCISTPEFLPDGRLKFKEEWQWLSGDNSCGYSEIEEITHTKNK
jgi:hypothetical protein